MLSLIRGVGKNLLTTRERERERNIIHLRKKKRMLTTHDLENIDHIRIHVTDTMWRKIGVTICVIPKFDCLLSLQAITLSVTVVLPHSGIIGGRRMRVDLVSIPITM